ncbi:sugar transferase [Cohnella silvisoli]|uniref:Sugar transferase n=1 Tax=Cohnella silvisoli TaxID=2873699 RepID=A0ABV1KQS8_9BACL|nr:sugar transferase [Cohnella silvisoli]MCD9024657.1 sugar transferase [Cohnella silvisoli]
MIVVQERKGYLIAKRLMDIIGTLMGIILFSLVMILVAILIKLEDPRGKVLFKQARIGKSGKSFQIYKFRSMSADAEEKLKELLPANEATGAIFKIRNDPRVTKLGKWIRRTSIDELPQIWNVLKGDMSLVGPRPPLPREVKEYSEFDKQRLLVTPGCTGLWQISGRGRLGFEEMLALDLKYIQKRSITTDIGIIVKTFGLLFKGY